ncbi:MAG: hypothetical protein ACT4N8_12340, partial [Sphingosinicella sp.]|uniref:hypothetical protein n=1 Tax=Sphingosinicella sp. TaxID=1917971 RepID=UPI0040376CD2
GSRELVIISQSLGGRLSIEFLTHLERSSRPAKLDKIVVFLMAAAVPIELDQLIAEATRNADEIVVLHSIHDKVLRRWFRLGQTVAREGRWPEAVGYAGRPGSPPWSFDRGMNGYDHGDYWDDPGACEAIGERLQAYFPGIAFRANFERENKLPQHELVEAPPLPLWAIGQL